MALTRKRAITSGIMQCVGGVLISMGSLASQNDSSPGWTLWIGSLVGVYFLATGGYRTREAFKMQKD
jgi:ascorbate-specific PTS system EIIC-type component UlaA